MTYFTAVQEGKVRVKRAVDLLQEVAGPSFAVLFLKEGKEEWTPVGEEMLYSIAEGKGSTMSLIICDGEGNAKAMSEWFAPAEVRRLAAALKSRGVQGYAGRVRLPT
jgi:hypothetical protein